MEIGFTGVILLSFFVRAGFTERLYYGGAKFCVAMDLVILFIAGEIL